MPRDGLRTGTLRRSSYPEDIPRFLLKFHWIAPALLLLCGIQAFAQTPNPQASPTQQASPAPQDIPAVVTSITVNEHIATESPANVDALSGAQISQTPGAQLDDRLRMVPGFSLFRRTSSEIANPTTQGVSLRGIGSSGASRTLVLFDGVPLNDPFGGWVYWTRFSPEDIDRVEISRGASTSLFGNLAMGGVINLFPVEPRAQHLSAGAEAGTQNTYDVFAGFSQTFRNFAISAGGRGFTTEGYYVVPGDLRGAIDRKANVRFVNDDLRLDGFLGRQRLYASVNSVVEERGNGTYITHNSTAVGTGSLRYVYASGSDSFAVTGFGTTGEFHSIYSSIAAGRNSERLVSTQTVPESALGGSGIYSHRTSDWSLTAGADAVQDRGFSHDYFPGKSARVAGGSILDHGEFLQASGHLSFLQLFAGGRHEFTGLGGREFFNPSGGFVAGRNRLRARGSVYRAFRSPSLNELFREFRVGNIDTLPNPQLQPERLFGAELGVDYTTEFGTLRVTAFRNELHGLVTNVTLSSTKNAITRERENAADALNRGFEISWNARWHDWTGEAAYLFADSRYDTGLRVPQIPRSQGSASVTWQRNRTLASAAVRSYSSQFDDDQNRFLLPGFAMAQLLVRERLFAGVFASLEATNLLDRTFYTGFTPTPTIGEPRIIRAGLLWKWN